MLIKFNKNVKCFKYDLLMLFLVLSIKNQILMRKYLLLLFSVFFITSNYSNQVIIDSLKSEIHNNPTKVELCEIYLNISEYIYVYSADSMYYYSQLAYELAQEGISSRKNKDDFKLMESYSINNIGSYYNDIGNIDTALILYEKAFIGFEEANDKMGMAIASNNIGYVYNNFIVDIPKAIEYYKKSIDYLKDIEADALVANLLNNLAYVYHNQGDYKRALAMFFEALKLRDEAKDIRGLGEIYNNIGAIYQDLEDVELATEYYYKSLEIRASIPDSLGMSYNYNNLASLYMEEKDFIQAMKYHKYALRLREKIKRPNLVSESLGNIGLIHIYLTQFDSASILLKKSLEINQSLGDKVSEAAVLGNLGLMEYKKGIYTNALKFSQQSYQIAVVHDFEKYKRSSAKLMYQSFKKIGKADSALKYYEIFNVMKDSLLSKDNIKESIKLKTRYEIEREELIKNQKEKEAIKKAEEKESRRNSIQYTLILIGLLVLAGIILSLGMIQVSERQAQGLIFLTFLIFFEFLLVVTDPYVDTFSGGAPIIKLGVNAVLAALIFPVHSYLEKRIRKRVLR